MVLIPDFRIPSQHLVIEADGRDGHADVEFALSDDERDRHYRRLGNSIMRFGWWEVERERGRIVSALRDHTARIKVNGGSCR